MISTGKKRRTAHQQVTDWLEKEGLTRDITQGSVSHWKLGPFSCCLVVTGNDGKSCAIHWSKWSLSLISGRFPDQVHRGPFIIQNRDDLRQFQKAFSFLISENRVSAYRRVEGLKQESQLPSDPFDLVDAIILQN